MSDLKAIETTYKGYRFRSRLEARWAVFFDKNGIQWEYEKEGFDLGGGDFYLPDFWLPQVQNWAEVKPIDLTENEMRLCKKLVAGTSFNCLMLVGVPDFIEYNAICKGENWNDGENDFEIINFMLTDEYINSENRFFCMGYPEPNDYEYFGERYTKAVWAARSARFEHGENGETVSYKSKRQKTREALNKAFSVDAVKPFYPMLFTLPCGHPDIDGDEDNKLDAVYTCAKEKYNFLDTLFFYHQVNQKEWLIEIDRLKALLEELREENEYVPDEETKIEIRQVLKELYKIRSTTGLTYVIEGW